MCIQRVRVERKKSRGKRKNWWKVWEKRPLKTNAFLSNPDGTVTELKSIITND